MAKSKSDERDQRDVLERMNKALKAALETPPKPHKDEPKRRKHSSKPDR